ncbi:MAG TPA: SIMPL domain-containing protein [Mycobacteriales bacterium]|nr:SIMPL domain-containing protein [Mycobacteriales bacterium]
MKRLLALLALVALGGYVLIGGRAPQRAAVAADVPTTTNGVVVDGVGKVSGTPDVLRVTLGVSVRRGDVSSAMASASSRQNKVRAALRHRGVAERDLQTADVSVYPETDAKGRPNGYRVTQTLTAKLRHLGTAGRAITDAVEAGGDETVVQGVSFALEDNTDLLVRARDDAYADAKAKAERYAHLSGRSLGEVQLVAETADPSQVRPMAYATMQAKDARSLAIDPGTSDVVVSVTVRWSLR